LYSHFPSEGQPKGSLNPLRPEIDITRVILTFGFHPGNIGIMSTQETYTAFEGTHRLVQGALQDVVLKIKKRLGKAENSSILIFSDETGKTMDFNFQGNEGDVLKRLEIYVSKDEPGEASGPGRPKLGVVSREVSLLPRHWEWLATQPGGASATIRKLIEDARKKSSGHVSIKLIQERTYRFMSVMAGDLEGYEEALRALYKSDRKALINYIQDWPRDIKDHVLEMAAPAFESQ
jgi:hypothetical protein